MARPKKTEEKVNFNNVDDLVNKLEKDHGKGTIMTEGRKALEDVKFIPTGLVSLDCALGGGIPSGRMIECYGPESCLDKDTIIKCYLKNPKGHEFGNTHKSWTIERLYERFHKIEVKGFGKYLRKQTLDYEFYVPSINEADGVFRNAVADVVKCGPKLCYEVKTELGYSIITTKDHKFFTGIDYDKLSDLDVGDIVYIHNNTHFKKKHKKIKYKECNLKYHPKMNAKVKNGYFYYPTRLCRIVFEAHLNNMTTDGYKSFLNTGTTAELSKLKFIPEGCDIHHKNFNSTDDSIDNLMAIESKDHNRLHANHHHNLLRFVAIPDKIISIRFISTRETYDIKCFSPYNNYVANHFVVHNSGKTSFTLHCIGIAQRLGRTAMFIDAEHSYDPKYAEKFRVDNSKLLLNQPDSAEQALTIMETSVASGLVNLIVLDSVAALTPLSEMEGEMGDAQMGKQARLMSQACRKLTGIIGKTDCTVIWINQIRMKIGVMFGNPETTTGGNALKFYCSQRIDVRRIGRIPKAKESQMTGMLQRFKVVKNKVAPPFRESEIELYFKSGYDSIGDTVSAAVDFDIIQKAGAWYSYGSERLGQGLAGAVKGYRKLDKETRREIKKKLKDCYEANA